MFTNLFTRLQNPLLLLGVFLFVTTSFFIAKQVKHLGLVTALQAVPNSLFYLLFALAGAGYLFLWWRVGKFSLSYLTRSLLFFLPATLTLLYGVAHSTKFHFLFQVLSGLILIVTIGLLFYQYFQKHPVATKNAWAIQAWFKSQGKLALLAVLFFTIIFFSFTTYRLGQFAAVDEPLWLYGRIEKFWNNIYEKEWQKTDVSDKPGITVAITSGIGLLRYEPAHFDDKRNQGEVFVHKSAEEMSSFFFTFRFPLVALITLLLPFVYFLLERVVGKRTALFSYAFLTTSPILIGVAKIINPDALLWLFTSLSLLSYLAFQKRPAVRYLFLSGVFLGLGLLTKYIANILFIYLLALLFLEYLYHPQQTARSLALYIRSTFIYMSFIIFTGLTTFYILLPANWVEPYELVRSTILSEAFLKVAPLFTAIVVLLLVDQAVNKNRFTSFVLQTANRLKVWLSYFIAALFLGSILFVLINTWLGMPLYNFMELISSPKTIGRNSDIAGIFLTNFYPLIFSLTPLALAGLIGSILLLFKKDAFTSDSLRFALYALIFTLIYYLGATVNGVGSIIRYQIIIFPLIALVSGIGFSALATWLEGKVPSQKKLVLPVLLSIIAISGICTLIKTPFPLSYASSLLPHQYYVDLKDMGPGSYEIAEKLNQLPDVQNILIWTDKDGVCQFFVGRCKRGNSQEAITDPDIDYIVISSARENRSNNMIKSRYDDNPGAVVPIHLFYNRTDEADYSVFINGRPSHFVKAYRYVPGEVKE